MASAEEYRPQRPRTSSMLSFGHRSHKSSGSVPKADLVESPKEKQSHRITGKADPSVAINELQPSVRAHEASTMAPLRAMQHRDSFGNVITDPDRSNPTRPRMERPLDTIRSFENAIDSGYNVRRQTMQPDMASRRASYHQGFSAPRTPAGMNGGYFDRQPNSRPDSMYSDQVNPNDRGYSGGDRGQNPQERPYQNYHQQRRYPPRNQSDPMMYGNPAYGNNGYNAGPQQAPAAPSTPGQWTHPSLAPSGAQETATVSTSSGSYATDQGTNSTEASLHNSSYGELPHQQYKPQPPPHDAYAGGFGRFPGYAEDEYGQPIANTRANKGYGPQTTDMAPPPPPAHGRGTFDGGNMLMKQAPQAAPQMSQAPATRPAAAEKRKSWLSRRFSKKS